MIGINYLNDLFHRGQQFTVRGARYCLSPWFRLQTRAQLFWDIFQRFSRRSKPSYSLNTACITIFTLKQLL